MKAVTSAVILSYKNDLNIADLKVFNIIQKQIMNFLEAKEPDLSRSSQARTIPTQRHYGEDRLAGIEPDLSAGTCLLAYHLHRLKSG